MKIALIAAFVGVLIGLSYLATVGVVALIQFLSNTLFATTFAYNVWLLGLLVWVVMAAIRSLFPSGK